MYSKIKIKSENYPSDEYRSYALIDEFGGGVIMEVVEAQEADDAIDYFDGCYPTRRAAGMTVWLLVGGEEVHNVD